MLPSIFLSLLLLLLLLLPSPSTSSPPPLTDRFRISKLFNSSSSSLSEAQEYIDPTFPPPSNSSSPPLCSQLLILNHSFADTYSRPPVTVPYSPPTDNCSVPWARLVLELSVFSAGDQYDRIAAVWVGGAEILRTSTAEPTDAGVFWRVRKDVTRYSSLLQAPGNVTMMLENLVNDEFTGVYHCNLSLEFYAMSSNDSDSGYTARRISEVSVITLHRDTVKVKSDGYNGDPADLILPVSNEKPETGYWFRIQNQDSDVKLRNLSIPLNAYRAVLEVYVSFHSNDEFWYSNPPDSYIKENNLTTGRGNGAFRHVVATIDDRVVGSFFPFPVVFTGGINPLFWTPVVAIGAFNLPSYDLDITPFLGLLLDGNTHEFGLNITDGISFWLVDANLHLWLDPMASSVKAELTQYVVPPLTPARSSKFLHLDGNFKIGAGSKVQFSGWVNSSFGNLTTVVNYKLKLRHMILFMENGTHKEVHMKARVKSSVIVSKGKGLMISQTAQKYKFPLMLFTSNLAAENNTYRMMTNLSHTLYEESSFHYGDKVISSKILSDKQYANGWMLVKDHSVLSGSAETVQTYQCKDGGSCFSRKVSTKDGKFLDDSTTKNCPSLSSD